MYRKKNSAGITVVASFHSGDPHQVVPFVLYTVVLHTFILHAGFTRHVTISFANFANVKIFCLISLQQSYVALSFANFARVRIFRYYFSVYGPLATLFKALFTQISLRNLQTTEAGVITVLYFNFRYTTFCNSFSAFSFSYADYAVQLHRPWAFSDPAFSLLPRLFKPCFLILNCVSHSDLQNRFLCKSGPHTFF